MPEETVATNMDGEAVTPDPEDDESNLDGCDVPFDEGKTSDEDLPATEGGVA